MSKIQDPWGNYIFSLELDGTEVGRFTECSGLKSSAEVFEIEEGGYNSGTRKVVGRSKWDNIVLKYATSASTVLLEWRDKYLQDGFDGRKDTTGCIVMRDNAGAELRRFNFVGCWPVSWEGPAFNGGGSDLAIESFEIAHEGIYIDNAKPTPPPTPEPLPDKIETEPIQFEFDSAELTPEGEATVDDLADQLKEHPEVETVYIEGHTCDMGSFGHNMGLSMQRAESVKARLKPQNPDKTYIATGYAYKHPVASNSSQAGREKNRRVDFFQSERAGKRPGELA
ncbi:MAG: phage tail protein [Proteobacteria bacterium]|nr:phage tail protein [Pseudomonadota bacterium]